MADSELMATLKSIVTKASKWIEDESKLTVTTNFMVAGQAAPELTAKTEVELTGDTTVDVPTNKSGEGVLSVATELYSLHQTNVEMALDYRTQLLNALMQGLKSIL